MSPILFTPRIQLYYFDFGIYSSKSQCGYSHDGPECCYIPVRKRLIDALSIVGSDVNQANLRKQLPKFNQQVTCPTRGTKTLDHVYCQFKGSFKSIERPHLGNSDHAMVLLLLTYKQQLKSSKALKKTITMSPESSIDKLRLFWLFFVWLF